MLTPREDSGGTRFFSALTVFLFAAFLAEFVLIGLSYRTLATLFQTYPPPAHAPGAADVAPMIAIPLVAILATTVYVACRWSDRARKDTPPKDPNVASDR